MSKEKFAERLSGHGQMFFGKRHKKEHFEKAFIGKFPEITWEIKKDYQTCRGKVIIDANRSPVVFVDEVTNTTACAAKKEAVASLLFACGKGKQIY